jgi:hypothetical protein
MWGWPWQVMSLPSKYSLSLTLSTYSRTMAGNEPAFKYSLAMVADRSPDAKVYIRMYILHVCACVCMCYIYIYRTIHPHHLQKLITVLGRFDTYKGGVWF